MGMQFVHRRMVATEAQIFYIQTLYCSLPIELVTERFSENEHSPVSKASGQPLWLHGEEAILGEIHLNNILQRENVKPCGNAWAKGKTRESGCTKDRGWLGDLHNRKTDLLNS